MKVYRFYFIEENTSNGKNSYELYALTNNKKLAKRFKEERDMKKFYVKETKMSKEEYAEVANNALQHILKVAKLSTAGVNENGMIISDKVEILLTEFEYDMCTAGDPFMEFSDPGFWNRAPSPSTVNKELKKAMDILDYTNFYKLCRDMYIAGCGDPPLLDIEDGDELFIFDDDNQPAPRFSRLELHDHELLDIDYDAPSVVPDQLGVFVANFHRTFK